MSEKIRPQDIVPGTGRPVVQAPVRGRFASDEDAQEAQEARNELWMSALIYGALFS